MARTAPTAIWEESNARKATSRAVRVYLTYADGAWSFSTDPDDQMGTFTLDADGIIVIDPGVVSGGRIMALGASSTIAFLGLPNSTTLASYVPGSSVTEARASTATYTEYAT